MVTFRCSIASSYAANQSTQYFKQLGLIRRGKIILVNIYFNAWKEEPLFLGLSLYRPEETKGINDLIEFRPNKSLVLLRP